MPDSADLTIAQLATRTGVAAGTLRMWGSRYGFPAGSGGDRRRRRYAETDAEAVLLVQRLRSEGLTMAAAMAEAGKRRRTPRPSIFAGLRERFPELRAIRMTKAALLELTRAVEDEHAARCGDGLLIGSFQQERHYRASEGRWRELARTASCAVALADFRALREPPLAPMEVPLPAGHALGREWTVIADSPGAQVCVSAWELPALRALPELQRRFEVVWSSVPAVVEEASATARSLIEAFEPSLAGRLESSVPSAGTAELQERFASDLASRAYEYLASRIGG